MKIKNKNLFKTAIVLVVLCQFFLSAALLPAAQKTKQLPPSITQPVKPPRLIPFRVWGQVLKDGKKALNVKVELVPVQRVKPLKQKAIKNTKTSNLKHMAAKKPEGTLDDNGLYSFAVDEAMKGQKYKLIPKHDNLPPGQYFYPREHEFTLNDDTKVNFRFNPPTFKIKIWPKTSNNAVLLGSTARIQEVADKNQYKKIINLKSESHYGYFQYNLNYDYYGKTIRIQPIHHMVGTYGTGFIPAEEQFVLKEDRKINFIYNGPLPDLTISKVTFPINSIHITCKNIGTLKSDKYKIKMTYRRYNKNTGEDSPKESKLLVSGLAAGASREEKFSMIKAPYEEIRNVFIHLDTDETVVESDETNNTY